MMMLLLKRFRYSFKLMFSVYFLGGTVLAVLFSVAAVQIENWHFAEANAESIRLMFTVVMPLVTIVFTANVFAEEFEERVFPLLWTYPVRKPLWFMERIITLLIVLGVYYSLSVWAVHHWLLELTRSQVWELFRDAAPTHVFLGGLTLLFSLLGRSALAGLAAGGVYWLMEMTTDGSWTKALYLFEPVWGLEIVSPEVNRWWVLGTGGLCMALSMLFMMLGRYWIAKK